MSALGEPALNSPAALRRLLSYSSRGLVRLRTQEALNAFGVALTISLWVLALLVFAERFFSLSALKVEIWIPWLCFTALAIPFILWRTFARRLNTRLAAVLADERLGLHARLSTALTLDEQQSGGAGFAEAFRAEALRRLSASKVEAAFPIKLPRSFRLLPLPAVLCAGLLLWMPPQDTLGLAATAENKRKAEDTRKQVARKMESRLEDLKKKVDEHADPQGAQARINQLIQKADAVAKELKDGRRDAEGAVVALGQVKHDIQDEKDKLQRGKEFIDRLQKLSAQDLPLEDSALTKDISAALKQDDTEEAARQMRKLAQDLRKDILDNPNKTDEQKRQELERLRGEVEKLAGALADNAALSAGLRELSKKILSASEYQSLQTAMKKLRDEQGKGGKKLGDDLQQQMNEVADLLEEAGENDEPLLSEAELKEMKELEEAEDGIDEAMAGLTCDNPGEAGGKSKKFIRAKSSGQRFPSGKKRLACRAGGSQSGKQGLSSAQCQGNGGQNGQGNGPPGSGLSSGKGLGSRPYRDGDAEFEKQKVKGQLQAGAITGLSHFRGQGVKGSAPQEFIATMKAAREEAESSLELERIPADARDVVKQYYLGVNSDEKPTPNAGQ